MLLGLTISACVEQPVHEADATHARLKSSTAMAAINGQIPSNPYLLMLPAGDYVLEVPYRTYRKTYHCRFQFTARGGHSYEIVEHSNPQPLVLYRWARANALWAKRVDPVNPECEAQAM